MMMNSYFEHQGGFYNGGPAAAAENQPYRFPQSLLVPPYSQAGAAQAVAPRNAHESSVPYGDANGGTGPCGKMYGSAGDAAGFKAECLVKEQNGFSQVVKDMVNWPAMARAANEQMRSFATENSAAPRGSEWQQCCQTSPAIGQTHSNTFYPWMAVQGVYRINNSIFFYTGLNNSIFLHWINNSLYFINYNISS